MMACLEIKQHLVAHSQGLNTNLPLLPEAEPLSFSLLKITHVRCSCLALAKSGISGHVQPHTVSPATAPREKVPMDASPGPCFILFLYPGPSVLLPSVFPTHPVLHSHSKIKSLLKCTVERMAALETRVLPSHVNWLNARMRSNEKR